MRRTPFVSLTIRNFTGPANRPCQSHVRNPQGRPAMNTQWLPLPIAGGGWEGVSMNGVTEDVFHAVPLRHLKSVRTIAETVGRPGRAALAGMCRA
ncbi:hypothetical protein GCM10008959_09480 [Deinococcus seoulensis]|uniref:Uncharacterized protein n=1 Tax=Deinococcus seoulensis TaxID=1837379 RepID=A0ABQ2RNJ1_9DEIO|nr:hypothetical protein GCM10008959_09480 [Deinococcus seoulensis]